MESVLSAVSSLGPVDHGASSADVVDITPRGVQPLDAGGPDSAGPLVPATPPKMELEVPYRMYRITRIDGSTVDRVDKHPFCMSRVYYDAAEKPEEVSGARRRNWFPWLSHERAGKWLHSADKCSAFTNSTSCGPSWRMDLAVGGRPVLRSRSAC